MALSKNLPTPYGDAIRAEYHRICQLEIDYVHSCVRGVIASYASKGARQEGHAPLGQSAFEWGSDRWPFAECEPTRAAIYARLKEDGVFSGADDI